MLQMAYMVKLNTIDESVKWAVACLVTAERLRQRTTLVASSAADESIAEARRSLSEVRSLVTDLRRIYLAMDKSNQSLKNSPMVCKIHYVQFYSIGLIFPCIFKYFAFVKILWEMKM